MATFRIFIADDHEVVRKGLCALLQAEPGWEICGEASDGREAAEKVRELKPDVTILDIGMPSLNGLEATRQIIKEDPRAKVLVLTLHDSDQVVREVLNVEVVMSSPPVLSEMLLAALPRRLSALTLRLPLVMATVPV